jgi:hypothetical protein
VVRSAIVMELIKGRLQVGCPLTLKYVFPGACTNPWSLCAFFLEYESGLRRKQREEKHKKEWRRFREDSVR